MPVATIDPDATDKFDLKSLSGAYVVLRRMPYGKYLHRQEMALQLKIESRKGQSGSTGHMDMANRKVTEFEFAQCIVDHNLEDANGEPLDFTNPRSFEFLNPQVGNEIGDLINDLHQFDTVGN